MKKFKYSFICVLLCFQPSWQGSFFAQDLCDTVVSAWGMHEFTLESGISRISFVALGADGGNAAVRNTDIFGNVTTCTSMGGSGARVQATFSIGTGTNEIPAGSTIRLIVGQAGENHISDISFGTGYAYGGGGGGSAVLYRAPGSPVWTTLLAAGGGGGAYQGMFANACIDNENGQGGRSGTSGGNGTGDIGPGSGGFSGTSGDGGGASGLISAGGGGAFSDGGGIPCDGFNGEGKAGLPAGGAGGTQETCFLGELFKYGGFGFGGGGAGRGAGGGGGGYAGGGGGGTTGSGGGGGSGVDPRAISQGITAGGNDPASLDGSIAISCSLAPIAICKNVTLDLEEGDTVFVTISDIDDGSYDPGGGALEKVLFSPPFTCDSAGTRFVTLTVYNEEGLSSECMAQVTILEMTPPTIHCQDPIRVDVSGSGLCGAYVPYYMACTDCSSCTILQIEGLPNGAFFPVGTTINSFVAIDASGNRSDTCSFTVTVVDAEMPTAVCLSFVEVSPDTSGNYIPDPALINYGSYDNCGIGSLTVFPSLIPCAHESPKQMVTLIVKDLYGNQNTCSSELTLLDDDDYDGVGNDCDQCPGGDDQVDNDHDGQADCAVFPGMDHLIDSWKCGNNSNKVLICHIESLEPFVSTPLCVHPNAVAAHLAHGDFVGPCPGPMEAGSKKDSPSGPINSEINKGSGTMIASRDWSPVYPNPNSGNFRIRLNGLEISENAPATFSVYSTLGKKIWEEKTFVGALQTLQVDLHESLPPDGIYLLHIRNGEKSIVKKFQIGRP